MAVSSGARALGQKQSETGKPGRSAGSPASPGPLHPVLQLQQSVGNQALLGLLGSGNRQASGAGRPLPSAVRGLMEERFQADFGGVRVHTDNRSAMLSRALQARAFTRGSDIFFSAGRYSPGSPAGARLLAHELAHVVQQGGKTGGTARLGDPGSSAERGAERAAEAVMAGAPVPDPGGAPAGEIQRSLDPVSTNGGVWTPTRYAAVNVGAGVGKGIGADIALGFMPIDPVEADNIGLVQSVKTLESTTPGGAVDSPSTVGARNASLNLTAGEGDLGRAIDQGDSGDADTIPNTNPLYAVENTPGSVSRTLTDVGANFGTHGHRTRRTPGLPDWLTTWDEQAATISDRPSRRITFAGQQYRQTFEVTALVLDGPMAGTYLGSVEWGWSANAAGDATLNPDPIRIVRAGAPTSQFMAAAQKWNNATFTDPTTGTVHDTVDLPLTTIDSGSVPVQGRTTSDLLTRLPALEAELLTMAAGVDRTNKTFEKQAIEAELRRRNAKVAVHVLSTEDWTGADEVYVRMSGSGRSFQTPVHDLNDGQSFDFLVPLAPLLPLTGPVTVDVYDEDSPDGDDHIVNFAWPSPYGQAHNTTSMDDANYRVTVEFER